MNPFLFPFQVQHLLWYISMYNIHNTNVCMCLYISQSMLSKLSTSIQVKLIEYISYSRMDTRTVQTVNRHYKSKIMVAHPFTTAFGRTNPTQDSCSSPNSSPIASSTRHSQCPHLQSARIDVTKRWWRKKTGLVTRAEDVDSVYQKTRISLPEPPNYSILQLECCIQCNSATAQLGSAPGAGRKHPTHRCCANELQFCHHLMQTKWLKKS